MADNDAATRKDLRELEERLTKRFKSDLAESEDRVTKLFKSDLAESEDRLTEKMRDMQSEILRAFYNWARPLEATMRHIPEIEQRLGWLEERVNAIERGDPPPRPGPPRNQ